MESLTAQECLGRSVGALKGALLLPLAVFTAGCVNDPCDNHGMVVIAYRMAGPEPECPGTGADTGDTEADTDVGMSAGTGTSGDADDTGTTTSVDMSAGTETSGDASDTGAGSVSDTGATTGATTGAGSVSDTGDTDTDAASDTGSETGTDGDTGGVCDTRTPPATGPELLTAANYAVLAGSTVTNAGATVLDGDLGVSPGSALAGFPPGIVVGTSHANDAIAIQAQNDLTAAYVDAAARPGAIPLPADISGMTLAPGVYSVATSLQIAAADLTLDGGGDPNATWIFQIGTTLVTSSGADVLLADGACGSASNVFWQVGSSATLGTGTNFVGTIMADQSITAATGITVEGRLLARVGAVTLDTNLVTVP